MAKNLTSEEPVDDTRTFQSRENHYPQDQLLRKYGFRIHARKTDEEALWERDNKVFTHSGAIKLLPKHEKENIR